MTPGTVRSDLPRLVTPLPGPRARALVERDHAVVSPSYTRSYPFVIARGEGAIAEDVDGNRFLDFNAGIAVASTGHSHPRVVDAIRHQSEQFLHMSGTDFYYDGLVTLAERLDTIAPGDVPRRVYFGNSGTEAIEAAMKLARYHTGRDHFIAFYGCFHGRTMGALSLTSSKSIQRKGFGALVPGVHHLPYPNTYRRPAGLSPEDHAVDCARAIEDQVIRHLVAAEDIAAIFFEPIQGEGGYLIPPQAFFDELQEIAHRHGILLVADEVQSGIGRTGRLWACEHFGIVPDIVCSAKGIASGMPLSATIARRDVMNWQPGAHASTFGGNPVCIAAALATLDLIEQELMSNAERVGAYLLERLQRWPNCFPIIGDVRGLGLMIGVEIVRNRATKERAPDLRDKVVTMAFERGLLILGCGQNSVRLCPPLVVTKDQADFAAEVLEECLTELSAA
jgi:4-aminobutyrate aminotransferase